MENYNTIWHIKLYDNGRHFDDVYFVREEAARRYIEINRDIWRREGLFWTLGDETLWL